MDIWLRKRGLVGEIPDNERMAEGRAFEGTILRVGAERLGITVRRNTRRIPHPAWRDGVRLYATPDAFTVGGLELVEVKRVGWRNASDWDGGVPDYVAIQCHGQLAVCRKAARVHVIADVGGYVRTMVIERDDDITGHIAGLVADWWSMHIDGGTPPPALSEGDRWSLLRAMVRIPGRTEREATPAEEALAAAMRDVTGRTAADKALADLLRRQLADASLQQDIRGAGFTGRWSERQGTPVFTVRFADAL
jgi:Arc/MetJ family transcription regulator